MFTRVLLLSVVAGCGDSAKECDPDMPDTICTVAGQGTEGYAPPGQPGGDGGRALDAYLSWPEDTVIAPNGDLWIEDFNNYLMRAVDDKGMISTVIGTHLLGDSPDAGVSTCPALEASSNHTTSMQFSGGYLYMAAWHGSRIKRVNYATMELENYAGLGVRTRYSGDEGPAISAALDLPTAIAVDADGNIAIMDQANQVIRQVTTDGNIHRIAGKCVIEMTACDTPTLCTNSNKYVCGNPAVYCGSNGNIYGTNDCTPSFNGDGPALETRMAQQGGQIASPSGRLAYDSVGNLYFSDSGNNLIRVLDKASGNVRTIAGTGTAGYSGDGGPALSAQINYPVDLAIAPDGSIYFTDFYNSCVRKIDPGGIMSTVAGTCSSDPKDWGFAGDGGPPTKAKLNKPAGIDLVGNKLYISDTYNNRVRVVNL